MKRSCPALGPGGDIGEHVRLELPAVRLGEQARRLAGVESEVVGPDLGHLARRAHPGEGDRRGLPAREHDGQPLGGSCDKLPRDDPHIGRLVDDMEVVEDQDRAVFGDPRQLTQEDIGRRLASRTARREVAEHRGRCRREPGIVFSTRCDEVAQERDPVAILVVEPVPQGPQPRPLREIGKQRRLAVARVGQDQDHAMVDLGREPIEESIPGERLVPQGRALDLRRLDRVPVHSVASGSMCERVGRSLRPHGDRVPASGR